MQTSSGKGTIRNISNISNSYNVNDSVLLPTWAGSGVISGPSSNIPLKNFWFLNITLHKHRFFFFFSFFFFFLYLCPFVLKFSLLWFVQNTSFTLFLLYLLLVFLPFLPTISLPFWLFYSLLLCLFDSFTHCFFAFLTLSLILPLPFLLFYSLCLCIYTILLTVSAFLPLLLTVSAFFDSFTHASLPFWLFYSFCLCLSYLSLIVSAILPLLLTASLPFLLFYSIFVCLLPIYQSKSRVSLVQWLPQSYRPLSAHTGTLELLDRYGVPLNVFRSIKQVDKILCTW